MNNEKSVDERLQMLLASTEFLKASTESLHAQMEQFLEEGRRQREQQGQRQQYLERMERKHRRAIAAAILAYLNDLDNDFSKGESK